MEGVQYKYPIKKKFDPVKRCGGKAPNQTQFSKRQLYSCFFELKKEREYRWMGSNQGNKGPTIPQRQPINSYIYISFSPIHPYPHVSLTNQRLHVCLFLFRNFYTCFFFFKQQIKHTVLHIHPSQQTQQDNKNTPIY